jgi:hypothetical protein
LQFKNICISLRYIENHVKLLYFSVFRVFEKTYNFLFFIGKRESSVETFPQKSARMGKETGRKPERTEGGKGRTAERGSTGPPFPPSVLLPLYPTSPYNKESYAMDIREKAGCPEVYSFPKKYKL